MIRSTEIEEILRGEIVRANTIMNKRACSHLKDYCGPFAEVLKENTEVAKRTGLPLCQDTGVVEFFVFIGNRVVLEEPIDAILEKIVEEVYVNEPYRYSTVADPVFLRRNTKKNTPPVVHLFHEKGNKLQIRFIIKGGGSENLSVLFMLPPSSSPDFVEEKIVRHIEENGARGCPPLKIGIGIGGTSEKAMVMSKQALTLTEDERTGQKEYEQMEDRLLNRVNDLKIGYQGLGSGITAYTVRILHAPTHIATLPVAISVDCYLDRGGRIELEDI